MFRTEGALRQDHHNQLLAGYLAFVAGWVNSAGFILIGSFTSHVTGNVGRLADNLALGSHAAAALALTMIAAFFVGAFVASMAIESNLLRQRPYVYGTLLLCEAGLLATFHVLAVTVASRNPRLQDAQALLLCAAMGLQNSLVTRLSGAVVRTTHLTGVVTDLGIEGARWFRFWRGRVSRRWRIRLTMGDTPPSRPHGPKSALLLTIFASFLCGSGFGAAVAVQLRPWAVAVPFVLLVGGGLYALLSRKQLVGEGSHK
jgi:uncharacterized membrane protein YoaK (UPF0700 family)